jgi:hypothetical protein
MSATNDASISRADAAHIARLDKTIHDLQKRVAEQEAALQQVRPVVLLCEQLY